ncbi:hypothetical protein [Streptococcus anginosus]|uniref:Uncharacterized protein n=1 Tax=Streptococcus anginosus TaxID=1328 RepID=A0A448AHF7_STRAP|nr:hypothetical protein [Streptococcus anginosus]GAD40428.1 hypothetical protein ANG3_0891 [Streptococcus intermedius SK54 = ATCC 27335]EGL45278.1 hypothetical protein HMPREF9966_0657 [Streptococcus anginosus SK52 = DSM 20563]MBZ2156972.1 hypothetical protein [Streptococcus anginosus]ORE83504.1 hypothetical protein B6C93_02550 [Streptococcus anginosus SK52 = DSM 20563]UEB02630.1 hypothetical protein LK450_03015 [Streptococcus anginosus subsp. anginosus]
MNTFKLSFKSINFYNIFYILLIPLLLTGGGGLLLKLCLVVFQTPLIITNIFTFLSAKLLALALRLFLLLLGITAIKWLLNQKLNMWKSLYYTNKIRRFAYTTSEKSLNIGQDKIPYSVADKRLANRSLLSLTVECEEDKIITSIKLPANHKAMKIVKELLPDIKNHLTELDPAYSFNDFTLESYRVYQAIGTRTK